MLEEPIRGCSNHFTSVSLLQSWTTIYDLNLQT